VTVRFCFGGGGVLYLGGLQVEIFVRLGGLIGWKEARRVDVVDYLCGCGHLDQVCLRCTRHWVCSR
jgi:hypothetical protein